MMAKNLPPGAGPDAALALDLAASAWFREARQTVPLSMIGCYQA